MQKYYIAKNQKECLKYFPLHALKNLLRLCRILTTDVIQSIFNFKNSKLIKIFKMSEKNNNVINLNCRYKLHILTNAKFSPKFKFKVFSMTSLNFTRE